MPLLQTTVSFAFFPVALCTHAGAQAAAAAAAAAPDYSVDVLINNVRSSTREAADCTYEAFNAFVGAHAWRRSSFKHIARSSCVYLKRRWQELILSFQCDGIQAYLPSSLVGDAIDKCAIFADSAHYLTSLPYPTAEQSFVSVVSHIHCRPS